MTQPRSSGPFRVGVIGLGDISDVYLDNLRSYPDIVEVSAVAARRREAAEAKATQHGIPKSYGTGEELIADADIDIVLNLTTPEAHTPLNLAALEASKHVYTEKPLGATFAEGRQIMDLAAERGVLVGCAPDTFLGGRLQTCRRLIDDGTVGSIVGAGAWVVSHGHEWFHPSPGFFYRPGGGPVHDIGPYYITALLSLLGPVESCIGMSSRASDERTIESEPRRGEQIPVEVDTHVAGTIRFRSGAIATIVASFDVWDSNLPRLEIWGTRATLSIADPDPVDGPNLFGGDVEIRDRSNYRWTTLPRPHPQPSGRSADNRHRYNEVVHSRNSRGIGLVDLAYAIRDGRPARASGSMALHGLELMDALTVGGDELYRMTTTFDIPAPLPSDFPDREGPGAAVARSQ